jgi:2'-5' RNA ligase
MVRAFIALELSEEIREALAGAQDQLRRCRAGLTFVKPAQIHITAKFLGEVEEKKMPALISALESVAFTPFPVRTAAVTVNNPRRPFTVWCAVDDRGRGGQLQEKIEDVLEPIGFLRETRPFTCHATIARVKRFDPSLMEVLRTLRDRTYGNCIIAGMKLKRSTLTPQGPVYEDIMEVRW